MDGLKNIEVAIEALPEKEYAKLRRWFLERDWERWDRQIAQDCEGGALNFLREEADAANESGELGAL